MSVMQMVVRVLPSEEEASIAAARMITQTRRPEQELVHIFIATLDLSWIQGLSMNEAPSCDLLWGKKRNWLPWAMSLGWKKSCYSHDKIKTDKHVQKVRRPVCRVHLCPGSTGISGAGSLSVVILQSHGLGVTWWLFLPGFIRTSSMRFHVHFEHQLIIFWRFKLIIQQECCSSELILWFSHGWPLCGFTHFSI